MAQPSNTDERDRADPLRMIAAICMCDVPVPKRTLGRNASTYRTPDQRLRATNAKSVIALSMKV